MIVLPVGARNDAVTVRRLDRVRQRKRHHDRGRVIFDQVSLLLGAEGCARYFREAEVIRRICQIPLLVLLLPSDDAVAQMVVPKPKLN
jgi:hypothetical protein